MNVDAGLTYLDFVRERHQVWLRRELGYEQPWTEDTILATRKFTNVFRVLDYGSQYVLTDLVDTELDWRGQLMRLFLYRHTGRVETWKVLELTCGLPSSVRDLDDVLSVLKTYRGDAHVRTRNVDPRSAGRTTQTDFKRSVFTNAYLVFPQSQVKGTDKLESIIELTRRLFDPRSSDDVVPSWELARTQAERFAALRRNKGVADFMSMQILTDWGYTPQCGEDRENEFVVAGPGALKGAAVIAPDWPVEKTLEWAWDMLKTDGPTVQGRPVSLMDVQNTLCEFSKYARYAAKPSPQQPYKPAHLGLTSYVLPQHWL